MHRNSRPLFSQPSTLLIWILSVTLLPLPSNFEQKYYFLILFPLKYYVNKCDWYLNTICMSICVYLFVTNIARPPVLSVKFIFKCGIIKPQ